MPEHDPSEKYRDKVDPLYRAAIEAIGFARMIMTQHRDQYDRLLKAEQDAHSFVHVINPTLYRDMITSKNFERQTRLIRAAVAFLAAVDEVANELPPDK